MRGIHWLLYCLWLKSYISGFSKTQTPVSCEKTKFTHCYAACDSSHTLAASQKHKHPVFCEKTIKFTHCYAACDSSHTLAASQKQKHPVSCEKSIKFTGCYSAFDSSHTLAASQKHKTPFILWKVIKIHCLLFWLKSYISGFSKTETSCILWKDNKTLSYAPSCCLPHRRFPCLTRQAVVNMVMNIRVP
jgi:hypothetical protein